VKPTVFELACSDAEFESMRNVIFTDGVIRHREDVFGCFFRLKTAHFSA
jgi:hypothetical protein